MPGFEHGWLAFRTGGERRRLAQYPADWMTLSDADLAALLASASVHVPPQRFAS